MHVCFSDFSVIVFRLSSYKCDSISPLDDLAFDMYQDPEVAHIIRLLDQRKQDVVQQEKFDLAKKLKQAIADLQKVIVYALFLLFCYV